MKASNLILKSVELPSSFPFYMSYKAVYDFHRDKSRTTLHWHDNYEVEFIAAGNGINIINGNRFEVSRGSAYLLTPIDFHSIFPVSDNPEDQLTIYDIRFNTNLLPNFLMQELINFKDTKSVFFDMDEFGTILIGLEKIRNEYNNNNLFRQDMISANFISLMVSFCRKLYSNSSTESGRRIGEGTADDPVRQAVAYIHNNFKNKKLSVKTLAEQYHFTPNYFGELFRKSLGLSCNSYIKQLRIDFARGLLLNSELPISEICYLCGFSSPSYFISEFSRLNSCSPARYRNMHKEPEYSKNS